jgi:prepilin-type N-terminal cleavage/methylation domain-containing protein
MKRGFTLLEILLAMMIFALSALALMKSGINSRRSVNDSTFLFTALQLAQSKMAEMELKYQRQVDRDGVKEGKMAEEAGTFDEPNQDYKWSVLLTEPSVKVGRSEMRKLMVSMGADEDIIDAQLEDPMYRLVLSNLNSMIKANYAELIVNVEWTFGKKKYSLPIVTHLIPAKPKIEISTTPKDDES